MHLRCLPKNEQCTEGFTSAQILKILFFYDVLLSFTNERYLNKKQTAEKMEQHYQTTSSVDYSLKEGETLILHIKNKGSGRAKSALFERLTSLSLDEKSNVKEGEGTISLKPPPPPPSSPVSPIQSPSFSSATSNLSRSPSSSIHGSTEFQVPLHEYESYPDKEPPSDAEAGTSDGAEQDDFAFPEAKETSNKANSIYFRRLGNDYEAAEEEEEEAVVEEVDDRPRATTPTPPASEQPQHEDDERVTDGRN
ncbi:hypothetical protein AXF42_Ash002370 [Apostasia shenzhenica]|uniref:Uncharacterized protein n=1 Tax=Apostasia shenzhenica TaxID=1088818 RepID=A0A2I0ANM1_9ASPA|nr:hypothetical protein AXF42_Ash002370 [Apostasia shenzhenica]